MALNPEEEKYYSSRILFDELQAFLLLPPDLDATPDDKQALVLARMLFAVGEAQQYLTLQPVSTTEPPLLGLNPGFVRTAWGLRDPGQVEELKARIRTSLLPDIERRIKDKCRLVCGVVCPMEGDTSLPMARFDQLPVEILKMQSASSQLAKELVGLQEAHDIRVQETGAIVEAMTSVLLQTLHAKDQTAFVTTKVASLEAYIAAMQQKTLLLTKQILAETYSQRKLDALRVIRQRLVARLNAAEAAQKEAQARLQQYELLGPAFAATADEYGRVRSKIAEKETWIASLDSSC
ncbi:hypothetical protein ACHHYP_11362 [Achlya hypogyna]|uniref:Uncharacterized protein n=1 Tax=Achlya hypogyna TaxID=1202772 RepID=A0A1V9YJD3_ACHHY|nr:hypothetical protein ACHHYP_11362 [Achlya hypogyna]